MFQINAKMVILSNSMTYNFISFMMRMQYYKLKNYHPNLNNNIINNQWMFDNS